MTHHDQKGIAIVLCAGFATRLRPLSALIPKVILPIKNQPIAWRSLAAFLEAGFSQVHVNLHHGADFVEEELKAAALFYGYEQHFIRFWREEPHILETGGGIARIVQELGKENPHGQNQGVFVVSGDIWAPNPVTLLIDAWNARRPTAKALMCTIPLLEDRADVTWVDPQSHTIVGFGSSTVPKQKLDESTDARSNKKACLFSNHQVIDQSLISHVPIIKESSITLFFKTCLQQGNLIEQVDYPEPQQWHNVGTPQELIDCMRAERDDIGIKYHHFYQRIALALPGSESKQSSWHFYDFSSFLNSLNETNSLVTFNQLHTFPKHYLLGNRLGTLIQSLNSESDHLSQSVSLSKSLSQHSLHSLTSSKNLIIYKITYDSVASSRLLHSLSTSLQSSLREQKTCLLVSLSQFTDVIPSSSVSASPVLTAVPQPTALESLVYLLLPLTPEPDEPQLQNHLPRGLTKPFRA